MKVFYYYFIISETLNRTLVSWKIQGSLRKVIWQLSCTNKQTYKSFCNSKLPEANWISTEMNTSISRPIPLRYHRISLTRLLPKKISREIESDASKWNCKHEHKKMKSTQTHTSKVSECLKKMKNDEISYHSSFFNFFFSSVPSDERARCGVGVTVKRDDIIIIINITNFAKDETWKRK